MSPASRVLIVDESTDSRQVLRVALERLGAETIEASEPLAAVEATSQAVPDLIVLDADSDHSPNGAGSEALKAVADRNGAPVVVLGVMAGLKADEGSDCVPKPYHYGPLIRKIEGLLNGRRVA